MTCLTMIRHRLINTPLQRGDLALAERFNRFSGFHRARKPLKRFVPLERLHTPLKR